MMAAEMTGAAGPGRGGRMSRRRKRDAVLRLLRGEDLEMVSRSLGVTAATLTAWRDAFLTAGEARRSFDTVEELRQALLEFRDTYIATWLVERHGFRPPSAARQDQLSTAALAA